MVNSTAWLFLTWIKAWIAQQRRHAEGDDAPRCDLTVLAWARRLRVLRAVGAVALSADAMAGWASLRLR
jgi:hypothetical protein